MLTLLGVILLISRTSFGLDIRTVIQNREMAEGVGINTRRTYAIAFTFGARLVLQPTQEQLSMTISKLAESESRTRAVVNAMEDGMFIVDESGHIAWSYLSPIAVNPGADGILDALERMPKLETADV